MSADGHWLDRLALRTRRETLQAAVAGAAALTLPFAARLPTAGAASETACRKGCLWSNGKDFHARARVCHARGISAVTMLAWGGAVPILALALTASAYIQLAAFSSCVDHSILQTKAGAYDCLQPNCPGFDPRKAGGPCDGCQVKCCTCQASDNGYICCIFECGDSNHSCCPGG